MHNQTQGEGLYRKIKMLLNKKGQLGPQELEDIPAALVAFLVLIGSLVIVFSIYSGHISESGLGDLHEVGRRLADTMSGDLFKSQYSMSFGGRVLDRAVLEELSLSDPALDGIVGSMEYGFNGVVRADLDMWEFGEPIPTEQTVLSYHRPVTILSGNDLHNGGVIIKVWRK